MTPDPTPTLRALAEQDPTATYFHAIPVQFNDGTALTPEQAEVTARLFKHLGDNT